MKISLKNLNKILSSVSGSKNISDRKQLEVKNKNIALDEDEETTILNSFNNEENESDLSILINTFTKFESYLEIVFNFMNNLTEKSGLEVNQNLNQNQMNLNIRNQINNNIFLNNNKNIQIQPVYLKLLSKVSLMSSIFQIDFSEIKILELSYWKILSKKFIEKIKEENFAQVTNVNEKFVTNTFKTLCDNFAINAKIEFDVLNNSLFSSHKITNLIFEINFIFVGFNSPFDSIDSNLNSDTNKNILNLLSNCMCMYFKKRFADQKKKELNCYLKINFVSSNDCNGNNSGNCSFSQGSSKANCTKSSKQINNSIIKRGFFIFASSIYCLNQINFKELVGLSFSIMSSLNKIVKKRSSISKQISFNESKIKNYFTTEDDTQTRKSCNIFQSKIHKKIISLITRFTDYAQIKYFKEKNYFSNNTYIKEKEK